MHKLIDIFAITVCAVICGASAWNEIEQYGQSKHDRLKTFLELPNGIPSHDTIRRVFIIIDAEEFGKKVRAYWGIENKLHWVLDVSSEKMSVENEPLMQLKTLQWYAILLKNIDTFIAYC